MPRGTARRRQIGMRAAANGPRRFSFRNIFRNRTSLPKPAQLPHCSRKNFSGNLQSSPSLLEVGARMWQARRTVAPWQTILAPSPQTHSYRPPSRTIPTRTQEGKSYRVSINSDEFAAIAIWQLPSYRSRAPRSRCAGHADGRISLEPLPRCRDEHLLARPRRRHISGKAVRRVFRSSRAPRAASPCRPGDEPSE